MFSSRSITIPTFGYLKNFPRFEQGHGAFVQGGEEYQGAIFYHTLAARANYSYQPGNRQGHLIR